MPLAQRVHLRLVDLVGRVGDDQLRVADIPGRKEHQLELLLDVRRAADDQVGLHAHAGVLDATAAKGCALSNMVEQPLPALLPQFIMECLISMALLALSLSLHFNQLLGIQLGSAVPRSARQ